MLLFQIIGFILAFISFISLKWKTIIFVYFFSWFVIYSWAYDISLESTYNGLHTRVVTQGLRIGMFLFILSEVMFFFSFFWSFFNTTSTPTIWIGSMWPPEGILALNPWGFPLLNTILLVFSGVSITLAHQAILLRNSSYVSYFLFWTRRLGLLFVFFQALEYALSYFSINDSIYGSLFYVTTGFHGFHVIIGLIFITIIYRRIRKRRFRIDQHFFFEAAAWYWHFVDVVWLLLFLFMYWWGCCYDLDAPLKWYSQFHFQDSSNRYVELISLLYDDIFATLIWIVIFISYFLFISIYCFSSNEYLKSVRPRYRIEHDSTIEIFWTFIPAIILIFIGGPSTAILYSLTFSYNDSSFYVRVLATQWYWVYSYHLSNLWNHSTKEFKIESVMRTTRNKSLKFGHFRLLSCSSRLILPTNRFVRFFITSNDVIHSFSIPSLFVKVDACPGKLNEFTTTINRSGILYGQCSEICGTNHSFMPIIIEAIPSYKFFYSIR